MADKQKYLDYDGTAILKNKILEELAENYDNRLLATNYFNEINGFSTNSKYEASNFEFEDTANYNLVTMVFSSDEIVLTENLMCMISFKFYNANTNKSLSINKKILTSALTQDDEGIKYVLDATETGIGDYISTNIDNIDTIKSSYMYGAVSLCSIFNEDYDGSNIINGYNNIINGKEFVIVNGEDNTINTDTKYTHVSGSGNKIITNKYGMINGTTNKIENNSYDLMIGNYNYSNRGNCKTILGTRNRLYFGTYIPRNSWSRLNVNTSVSPVKLEIIFSIASNYTWLQSALPKVGDMIGLHSYYGIRPTTVLEIDMDDTYLVRLKVNMVESSENDGILNWCETDIHGILIETIGYSKSNNFISGDFNSSFANCSTIFGFGNSVSADYGFTAGRHNQVLAEHASALGWGNVIATNCGTALGRFCKKTDALFIVGNGEHQWARSNALTISKTGKLTIADDLVYNGNTSLSAKIEEIGININSLSPVVYDCIVNESFAPNSHIIVYENESIVTINVYLYTTEDKTWTTDDVLIGGLPSAVNVKGGFNIGDKILDFIIDIDGNLKASTECVITANNPIVGTYVYIKNTSGIVYQLTDRVFDGASVIDTGIPLFTGERTRFTIFADFVVPNSVGERVFSCLALGGDGKYYEHIEFGIKLNGSLYCVIKETVLVGEADGSDNIIVTPGETKKIALTRDGSLFTLYIDGVKHKEANISIENANQSFYVGAGTAGNVIGEYFNGTVNKIEVYEVCMTEDEIVNL